jgi:predicted DNA-binding transcriptional regulator YafY
MKTERLFAVMDALRRHRHPVTAAQLAELLLADARAFFAALR